MNQTLRTLALAAFTAGCAVSRGQETVGAYIDDATVTTSVQGKLVADNTIDAAAIKVETLNGTVQLSGFAKSANERTQAENLARSASGVKNVVNSIVVRN